MFDFLLLSERCSQVEAAEATLQAQLDKSRHVNEACERHSGTCRK